MGQKTDYSAVTEDSRIRRESCQRLKNFEPILKKWNNGNQLNRFMFGFTHVFSECQRCKDIPEPLEYFLSDGPSKAAIEGDECKVNGKLKAVLLVIHWRWPYRYTFKKRAGFRIAGNREHFHFCDIQLKYPDLVPYIRIPQYRLTQIQEYTTISEDFIDQYIKKFVEEFRGPRQLDTPEVIKSHIKRAELVCSYCERAVWPRPIRCSNKADKHRMAHYSCIVKDCRTREMKFLMTVNVVQCPMSKCHSGKPLRVEKKHLPRFTQLIPLIRGTELCPLCDTYDFYGYAHNCPPKEVDETKVSTKCAVPERNADTDSEVEDEEEADDQPEIENSGDDKDSDGGSDDENSNSEEESQGTASLRIDLSAVSHPTEDEEVDDYDTGEVLSESMATTNVEGQERHVEAAKALLSIQVPLGSLIRQVSKDGDAEETKESADKPESQSPNKSESQSEPTDTYKSLDTSGVAKNFTKDLAEPRADRHQSTPIQKEKSHTISVNSEKGIDATETQKTPTKSDNIKTTEITTVDESGNPVPPPPQTPSISIPMVQIGNTPTIWSVMYEKEVEKRLEEKIIANTKIADLEEKIRKLKATKTPSLPLSSTQREEKLKEEHRKEMKDLHYVNTVLANLSRQYVSQNNQKHENHNRNLAIYAENAKLETTTELVVSPKELERMIGIPGFKLPEEYMDLITISDSQHETDIEVLETPQTKDNTEKSTKTQQRKKTSNKGKSLPPNVQIGTQASGSGLQPAVHISVIDQQLQRKRLINSSDESEEEVKKTSRRPTKKEKKDVEYRPSKLGRIPKSRQPH